MEGYADIVKPVAASKLRFSDVEAFAAGLGGSIDTALDQNWNRSILKIHSAEDNYTYECMTVLARCSGCRRCFYDITFTDSDGSVTGCPHCGATLNW